MGANPRPPGDGASAATGFYDENFVASADDLNRRIRAAAFGEDIGQFSWTTADEHRRFQQALRIDADSHVLEVASGSGGPALFLVACTGCRLTGIDIHGTGVNTANDTARQRRLDDRATFQVCDASGPLPFPDNTFDAIISIDSINHIFDRGPMFHEWSRVLRPAGRFLYTDAVVVTGPIRRDEMLLRSPAMGEFVFTPANADLPLLSAAGFIDVTINDVTDNIIGVARCWHDARSEHVAELDTLEGPDANVVFQRFLAAVHDLANERRLSRHAYTGNKPPPPDNR